MIVHSRLLFHPILLRSLVAVVDEGGFSRAARRLSMQQSTVSQHVSRLEEQLGVQLLDRRQARIGFTEAGLMVEQSVRDILSTYERLGNQLTGRELHGQVRIGSPEEFAVFRLPRILTAFRNVHPKVEIEVHVAPSEDLLEMFDGDRLDVAIFERRPGEARGSLIRQEALRWYGTRSNWPSSAETLPLVLYPEGSPVRDVVISACRATGRSWRPAGSSASYLGLRAAVLAGAGITALGASSMPVSIELAPSSIDLPLLPAIELAMDLRDQDPTTVALAEAILAAERD